MNVRSDSSTSEGKNQVNEDYLPKKRIRLLVAYNALLAILVSAALLLVVAFAPYPKSQAGQAMSLANVETALFPTLFSENTRNEVIPQMESLATLHNAGALTDDEFMAAKAKLLEK